MSNDFPLIENIGGLISYIQRENPDLTQMCQFAVLNTFSFLDATAMFGSTLGSDRMIRPTGHFGFATEVMQSWSASSIDEELPVSDALKTNNIVWLSDKNAWERDYPHLAQYKMEIVANTFITWPISVRGAYMSALGLCARYIEPPTPALISYFETVGGIFAMQLSQLANQSERDASTEFDDRLNLLTRRQKYVLALLAEGLTNAQIGSELGFSESTIRQETMRIYEILSVTGRAEAIQLYRKIGQKAQ